jgi:hypothetical protein
LEENNVSVLRKSSGGDGVVINNRFKWVEFTTEDDQVIKVKVRTSLMYEEIEKLVDLDFNANREELWEATYPYVTDWNLRVQDESDGQQYEVIPPSEGGVESFKYAPPNLVLAVIGALISEPFSKVDPKSSTPVETTAKP